jgi:5-formyltetrahydrofolate cyclo-ligase
VVEPDALIVPLLACDEEGWRLGYGGGFYDRTLAACGRKKRHRVGVGFNAQLVPKFRMVRAIKGSIGC